ncbi:MAG: CIA30 family protein [Planctomycetota bacterium]|jgi:ferric-dicitrate binding protein FerR (iron transport regulator)|nr:CIA30 family protein [Planctomycetota bacterium]
MKPHVAMAMWLDDREALDDEAFAALVAACENDPALSRQLAAQLQIDNALSLVFDGARSDFANRVRKGVTLRSSQRLFAGRVKERVRRRRQRSRGVQVGVVLAIAAMLVVGIGLVTAGALMSSPRPVMQPPGLVLASVGQLRVQAGTVLDAVTQVTLSDGAAVLEGQSLAVSPNGAAVLELGSGITVALSADCRLSVSGDAERGWWSRLSAGSVDVDCQHKLSAALHVETSEVLVSVLGTRFTVNANADASTVAVRSGKVRVDDRRGRSEVVPAGQRVVFATQQKSAVSTVLAIGAEDSGPWTRWANSGDLMAVVVDDGDAIRVDFQRFGSWLSFEKRAGCDIAQSDGLMLEWEGLGDGTVYVMEICDSATRGKGGERFMASFVDDTPGWRSVQLPWSHFARRDWQEAANPADDGLQRTRVTMFALWRTSPGSGTVRYRNWRVYRAQP